jgi:hypothetical protein
MEAKTVAKLLVEEVIVRFGTPYVIHTDQGVQFESNLFIGALFFLFGGFVCEQNEQPATYNLHPLANLAMFHHLIFTCLLDAPSFDFKCLLHAPSFHLQVSASCSII